MTAEQVTAILGALTALVVAIGATYRQVRELKQQVDGRLSELLTQTAQAQRRLGELEGRDFMRRLANPPLDPASPFGVEQISQPTDKSSASSEDTEHPLTGAS